MAVRTGSRDPRTIITPDAFAVSPLLLGMPLATPRARLIAIGIDLLVIGGITLLTRSFALVLGVLAALFFVRAGFKRTRVRGSVFGRAMRLSVGCLGLFIGGITATIWATLGFDFGLDSDDKPAAVLVDGAPITGDLGALGALGLARAALSFSTAEDEATAERALRALAATGHDFGLTRAQLRAALRDMVPDDAPWAETAPAMINAAFDDLADTDEPGAAAAVRAPDAAEISAEISGLSDDEAFAAYAALLRENTTGPRREALRLHLAGLVAADTLSTLDSRIADLEDEVRQADRQREALISSLEDAESGGLFGWLRRFIDELGFGFGWATLYLTVILSWWKGQTVGKRIMRIRVLRLDGEPIDWWTAFERAGGYAAGFATGLLGFAQVFWDANRQSIHDHIVGTVVVQDGAERVGNWEEAL